MISLLLKHIGPMILVLNLAPRKLSQTIWQKFNIRLWLINISFVSYAPFSVLINFAATVIILSYICTKALLIWYLLARSVKQTTFERPGSRNCKQYTLTRLFILRNMLLRNTRLKMPKKKKHVRNIDRLRFRILQQGILMN